jgi:hypothetical protein
LHERRALLLETRVSRGEPPFQGGDRLALLVAKGR